MKALNSPLSLFNKVLIKFLFKKNSLYCTMLRDMHKERII